MSLEVASLLEISETADKRAEEGLFLATGPLCLTVTLVHLNSQAFEIVDHLLARRSSP